MGGQALRRGDENEVLGGEQVWGPGVQGGLDREGNQRQMFLSWFFLESTQTVVKLCMCIE